MSRLKAKYNFGTEPEFDLDNGVDRYFVGFGNFGVAGVNHASEKSPRQTGTTHTGFSMQNRVLQVSIDLVAGSYTELSQKKNQMIEDLHPIPGRPLTLTYMPDPADESTYRAIEGYYQGGLDFPSKNQDGFEQRTILEFRCDNPVWYDPDARSTTFNLETVNELVFPIGFPISFSSSVLEEGATIEYLGNWPEYPILKVYGPLTAPLITNESLDLKIDFSSYDLAAGDVITLDLRPGKKTVTLDDGTNLINTLSDDSDLGDWRLAPAPEVPNGDNLIKVVAGNATSDSRIQVIFHYRYIGV